MAVVVALTVAPQLVESVLRVRRARRLRGGAGARPAGAAAACCCPVLEDALDRSLRLAAAMDSRGYGRRGTATRRERLGHRRAAPRRPARHLRRAVRPARRRRRLAAARAADVRWSAAPSRSCGLVLGGRRVHRTRVPARPVARAGVGRRRERRGLRGGHVRGRLGRPARSSYPSLASARSGRRCRCCPRSASSLRRAPAVLAPPVATPPRRAASRPQPSAPTHRSRARCGAA